MDYIYTYSSSVDRHGEFHTNTTVALLGCGVHLVKLLRTIAAHTAVASFVVAAAAVVSFAPAANAVSYTTSGFSLSGLGDKIGSGYDLLTGTAANGTLTSTITLNKLYFTAGINAIVPQYYPNVYSIAETMTIGGTSQQIKIPFNLNISYSDTLTVIGGTKFSFLDAGTLWQVVVNGLTLGPNPGGTMSGLLTAQVTDPVVSQAPLPAALPLFASGLGAMGLFGWYRKRKNASAAV